MDHAECRLLVDSASGGVAPPLDEGECKVRSHHHNVKSEVHDRWHRGPNDDCACFVSGILPRASQNGYSYSGFRSTPDQAIEYAKSHIMRMEEEMHEDDYGMLEVAFSSLAIAHYATTPESKDIYYEPILRKLFHKHCKQRDEMAFPSGPSFVTRGWRGGGGGGFGGGARVMSAIVIGSHHHARDLMHETHQTHRPEPWNPDVDVQ